MRCCERRVAILRALRLSWGSRFFSEYRPRLCENPLSFDSFRQGLQLAWQSWPMRDLDLPRNILEEPRLGTRRLHGCGDHLVGQQARPAAPMTDQQTPLGTPVSQVVDRVLADIELRSDDSDPLPNSEQQSLTRQTEVSMHQCQLRQSPLLCVAELNDALHGLCHQSQSCSDSLP